MRGSKSFSLAKYVQLERNMEPFEEKSEKKTNKKREIL